MDWVQKLQPYSEPRENSSDSRRSNSLSTICKSIDLAEEALQFPIRKLSASERYCLTDLTKRREEDLIKLFEFIYSELKSKVKIKSAKDRFPHSLVFETAKVDFMNLVLEKTVLFMIENVTGVEGRIATSPSETFRLTFEGGDREVKPDYLIQIEKKRRKTCESHCRR